MSEKKIIFADKIWNDRTNGENYFEFKYDVNEYGSRNIKDISIVRDGKNFANLVIFDIGEERFVKQNDALIEKYGLFKKYVYFGEEVDHNEMEKFLAKVSSEPLEYKIEPLFDNYFSLDIGDVVRVIVENKSDFISINSNFRVIQKSFDSKNDKISISVKKV